MKSKEEPKLDTVGKEFYENADMIITVIRSKEEIEQLANKYSSLGQAAGLTHREYTLENIAYRRGYEQCQEDMADKKYTEEDLRNAIDMARMLSHVACLEEGEHRIKYSNTEDEIINSLNKQD